MRPKASSRDGPPIYARSASSFASRQALPVPQSQHPSCAHLGEEHQHGLLCVEPAIASERLRRVADFLRVLHHETVVAGLPAPSGVSAYVRYKLPRAGERTNVDWSIEQLVRWARRYGTVPEGVPSGLSLFDEGYQIGVGDRGFDTPRTDKGGAPWTTTLSPEDTPPGEESPERLLNRKRVAVRRALFKLTLNRDWAPKVAARTVANAAFAMAGAIRVIARRIEIENLGLGMRRDCVWALVAGLPTGWLRAPLALCEVRNELLAISNRLLWLDVALSPPDVVRGARSEQTLFLAVIRDLEEGGFKEKDIAHLIDDGFGGTPEERTKRVHENLGRTDERGRLRDRRTRFIGGETPVGPLLPGPSAPCFLAPHS